MEGLTERCAVQFRHLDRWRLNASFKGTLMAGRKKSKTKEEEERDTEKRSQSSGQFKEEEEVRGGQRGGIISQ